MRLPFPFVLIRDPGDGKVLKVSDYAAEQWIESDGRTAWNHFENVGSTTTNHREEWLPKPTGTYCIHVYFGEDIGFASAKHNKTVLLDIILPYIPWSESGNQFKTAPPKIRKFRKLINLFMALMINISTFNVAEEVACYLDKCL